jgi:HEAT repeat protein
MEALRGEPGEMRRGALVGLLKSGSIEGIVYAGSELLEDLRSDSAPDRVFAAQVLRDSEIPSFYRQAIQLLNDRDIRVRSAAIEAAAKMGHAPLWPVVVDSLREPDLAGAASEALLEAGEDGVPSLLYGLDRHPEDTQFRLAILRILGLIKSDSALDKVAELARSEEREIRHGALQTLSKYSFRATGDRRRALKDQVRDEVRDIGEIYVGRQDLLPELSGSPLVRALTEEIRRGQHRIFLLMVPLFRDQDVLGTWESFSSANRNRRAYALELLESFLSVDERAWMYPVLEELPGDERVDRICHAQKHRRMSWQARVKWVLEDSQLSMWTRMCARHEGHERGLEVSAPTEAEAEILERAVRLRSVDLFDQMEDHVLAALAPRLQAVELGKGEVVFEQGDVGDCMYLVIDGSVLVHDADTTLAHLGANSVFGEFTVLHHGERTASVTAEEGTHLLRLTQTDLYDLIAEQASVAQSLIRLIVKRLRQNQITRAQEQATGQALI